MFLTSSFVLINTHRSIYCLNLSGLLIFYLVFLICAIFIHNDLLVQINLRFLNCLFLNRVFLGCRLLFCCVPTWLLDRHFLQGFITCFLDCFLFSKTSCLFAEDLTSTNSLFIIVHWRLVNQALCNLISHCFIPALRRRFISFKSATWWRHGQVLFFLAWLTGISGSFLSLFTIFGKMRSNSGTCFGWVSRWGVWAQPYLWSKIACLSSLARQIYLLFNGNSWRWVLELGNGSW